MAVDGLVGSDLAALEATIERGLATFVEVGQALGCIRDERLYTSAGYETFERYLRGRWDMARRTGYDYINAAEVVANVRAPAHAEPTLTQAVLLHRLAPEQQVEIASSVDFGTVPTRELAALVREARSELGARKPPQPPKKAPLGHQPQLHVLGEPRRLARFYTGDVREVLGRLEPEFAQCVMTSPPFWGLRDYKIPPSVWGQTCCEHEHEWGPIERGKRKDLLPIDQTKLVARVGTTDRQNDAATNGGQFCQHVHEWTDAPWRWNPGGNDEATSTLSGGGQQHQKKVGHKASMGAFCQCGAWYGQLGLEPWPQLYVEHIVEAFRYVWRALKKDGVLWLEIGDSYAGSGKGPTGWSGIGNHDERQGFVGSGQQSHSKVGWSTVHNHDERQGFSGGGPTFHGHSREYEDGRRAGFGNHEHDYRTRRSERAYEGWTIKPKDLLGIPWRVAFALQADGWYLRNDNIWHKPNPMPESMKDRCTRAHSYVFQLTKRRRFYFDAAAIAEPTSGNTHSRGNGSSPKADLDEFVQPGQARNAQKRLHRSPAAKSSLMTAYAASKSRSVRDGIDTRGGSQGNGHMEWDPETRNKRTVWTIPTRPFPEAHFATFPPDLVVDPIKATSRPGDVVLDPFSGAGTVALVAARLGRDSVGIDAKPEYVRMAERRLLNDAPMLVEVQIDP